MMAPMKKQQPKPPKRIRGWFGREKKSRDDSSTAYDHVDIDQHSIATASVTAPLSSSFYADTSCRDLKGFTLSGPIKIILVLMDAQTRRFELLQLEFESIETPVAEVLAQIPIMATEASLKTQSYTGLVGPYGKEMTGEVLLKSITGSDVLVAVPSGMLATECTKLAKPILSDDAVVRMLQANGVDVVSDW